MFKIKNGIIEGIMSRYSVAIITFLLSLSANLFCSPHLYANDNNIFSLPEELKDNYNFWRKVYSEYTTNQVIIHDQEDLSIIYDVITFKDGSEGKAISDIQKSREIKKVKDYYREILDQLSRKQGYGLASLTNAEKKVLDLFGKNNSPERLRMAAHNIRAQVGQKDKFISGIILSGRYIDRIKETFRNFGLPEELTVLPHVESSFRYDAYSKFGAAGIWQFTRSTGRRFLKIGYEIDERRDPILSTIAAAMLLKSNFEELGTWPLAITAYNHGVEGMKRAVKMLNTTNIVEIINRYDGRSFGFASRNFYTEYLAALHVVKNYDRYFGAITLDPAIEYDIFEIPSYMYIRDVVNHTNIDYNDIVKLNPAIRLPVLSSSKRLPAGYKLRIPKGSIDSVMVAYNNMPKEKKFSNQLKSKWYTVSEGETLSTIAKKLDTSVDRIMAFNNISNANTIYIGQNLAIPHKQEISKEQEDTKNKTQLNNTPLLTAKYVVKQGDTINRIAKRYGVEISKIKEANNIQNVHSIRKGRTLEIPDGKPVGESKESNKLPDIKTASLAVAHKISNTDTKQSEIPSGQQPDWILVEAEETLWHISEWLDIPTSLLRKINGLRRKEQIIIGQRLRVTFKNTSPEEFYTKRREYHKAIEEDLYASYYVESTITHKVKKGEKLWTLVNDIYNIPLWLIMNYNPNKDLQKLTVGDELIIPVISEKTSAT